MAIACATAKKAAMASSGSPCRIASSMMKKIPFMVATSPASRVAGSNRAAITSRNTPAQDAIRKAKAITIRRRSM